MQRVCALRSASKPTSLFRRPPRPLIRRLRVMAEHLAILRAVCAEVRKDAAGEVAWGEAWGSLQVLCPEAASSAAEILDQKVLTRVVARHSRREYFLVEGSGKACSHTVIPGFCTCQNYWKHVASRPDALVCKHELAVLLASALSRVQQRELDDGEWATQYAMALDLEMHGYVAGLLPSRHE